MIAQEYSGINRVSHRGGIDHDIPTVFVVDPDPATGKIVSGVLAGYPFEVQTFVSGRAFFAAYDGVQPGCLVLEQRIVDTSGLQIQRRLAERRQRLPMIYVSSSIDVSTAVVLMRGGAVHILEKPLRSIELLGAIQEALALDKNQRQREADKRRIRESIATLTHKERKLVCLLATATSNKSISDELSICARAVELRRRAVMEKLGLGSPMELVRFALLAQEEINGLLDAAGYQMDDTQFE
jgi:FixJ family two-component response regulator